MIERGISHCCGTGAVHQTTLQEYDYIHKRLLVHVPGADLGLVMRAPVGIGNLRREPDDLAAEFVHPLAKFMTWLRSPWRPGYTGAARRSPRAA